MFLADNNCTIIRYLSTTLSSNDGQNMSDSNATSSARYAFYARVLLQLHIGSPSHAARWNPPDAAEFKRVYSQC